MHPSLESSFGATPIFFLRIVAPSHAAADATRLETTMLSLLLVSVYPIS
jgi:hypothetical protein